MIERSWPSIIGLVAALAWAMPDAARALPADREALAAASRAFSAAYVANDSVALADCYTADAILLPPGRTIHGRAAAARYFHWRAPYRQLAHAMTSEDLHIDGDTAVDTGVWTSTGRRGDAAPVTASGRYLVVWVREADGRWRMRTDMWHRPPPAPGPAEDR